MSLICKTCVNCERIDKYNKFEQIEKYTHPVKYEYYACNVYGAIWESKTIKIFDCEEYEKDWVKVIKNGNK